MNDNVKKVFEMLGVKPNEEFKLKMKNTGGYVNAIYYFDKYLCLHSKEKKTCLTLANLLDDTYEIVKLPPKKKKLRDWTMDDLKKWTNVNCRDHPCDGCLFRNVFCSTYGIRVWINHKDLYSDKFLDQEVEVLEE